MKDGNHVSNLLNLLGLRVLVALMAPWVSLLAIDQCSLPYQIRLIGASMLKHSFYSDTRRTLPLPIAIHAAFH